MKFFIRYTLLLVAILFVGYVAWNPLHGKGAALPVENSAIWVENQWYSGVTKRGELVSEQELQTFVDNLRSANIRQVYLSMPPVNCDGTVDKLDGRLFQKLRSLTPEVTYIPWISGNPANFIGTEEEWNYNFLNAIYDLTAEGFNGVHLCFEPVDSGDARYLRLLSFLDKHLGEDFLLSHAMRRLSPIGGTPQGIDSFYWDETYYEECMKRTDETVLMCYDTALATKKLYGAYGTYQVEKALEIAARQGDHRVRVGLPAYDGGRYSNPNVETLHNGLGIVRSLSLSSSEVASFAGIAVYKYEHLDKREWQTLQNYSLNSLR